MDGALKKNIVMAVEPVFMYSLVNHLTGFVQVFAITMIQHLFSSYEVIDKIDREESAMKMTRTYDTTT